MYKDTQTSTIYRKSAGAQRGNKIPAGHSPAAAPHVVIVAAAMGYVAAHTESD